MTRRYTRLPAEADIYIYRMRGMGLLNAQIAAVLGCSLSRVSQVANGYETFLNPDSGNRYGKKVTGSADVGPGRQEA